MLIGICGAKCAGKSTVAQYLIEHHGFKKLQLQTPPSHNGVSLPESGDRTSNTTELPSKGASGTPDTTEGSLVPLPLHPKQESHTFATATALLDFVTKHWRSRWVTTDIHDEGVLDAVSRRPFFILISVDAPVTVRWRRHQQRASSRRRQQQQQQQQLQAPDTTANGTSSSEEEEPITLEDFVTASDAHLYSATQGVLPLMSQAKIRLLNTSASLAHLYASLGKLDLLHGDRLRPSWDSYFMSLASLAAQRCNCMKRAVGCVLVDSRHHVISTGYNGTPRSLVNCGEGGCPRCNSGEAGSGVSLATCLCLHAEENALLEAGRERIREGSVLYCNTCPCLTCSIKIVQVGISEVVYSQGYSMDGDTARVFQTAGVRLRQFSPPANGLIHLEKMELY